MNNLVHAAGWLHQNGTRVTFICTHELTSKARLQQITECNHIVLHTMLQESTSSIARSETAFKYIVFIQITKGANHAQQCLCFRLRERRIHFSAAHALGHEFSHETPHAGGVIDVADGLAT